MKKNNRDKINIIHGDAIEGMKKLPGSYFDLAICDPPYGAASEHKWNYDAKKAITGFGGDWKLNNEAWDLLSGNENFTMSFLWLKEIKRLVKPSGSLWIHATYHNSGFVNVCCQLLRLEIINEVVWYKRNAFPNLSARRLTASHETIIWAHTGEKKREYFFNYDETKKASFIEDKLKEAGKQLRTVWDIPNNKTKDELEAGTHPTQKPMLQLFDTCVHTIRTLPVLTPDRNNPEDVDSKLEDHLADALRYGVMSPYAKYPGQALRSSRGRTDAPAKRYDVLKDNGF